MDPRIQIWIHPKMSWIHNTGSRSRGWPGGSCDAPSRLPWSWWWTAAWPCWEPSPGPVHWGCCAPPTKPHTSKPGKDLTTRINRLFFIVHLIFFKPVTYSAFSLFGAMWNILCQKYAWCRSQRFFLLLQLTYRNQKCNKINAINVIAAPMVH